MLSACAFTVLLFHPSSPVAQAMPNPWARRACMGVAMGVTAVLIIHSPIGKRSGAHFNPAITLSYLRLGKIRRWDAVFYVIFQFIGGAFGVEVAAILFGALLASPSVDYAVTVPGIFGTAGAFFAELFMATLLMAVVLWLSNRPFSRLPHQLRRGRSHLAVRPLLRSSLRLQHQPRAHRRLRALRPSMDVGLALLRRAHAGHVNLVRDIPPQLWSRPNSLHKLHPDNSHPVRSSVNSRPSSHAHASYRPLAVRPNQPGRAGYLKPTTIESGPTRCST